MNSLLKLNLVIMITMTLILGLIAGGLSLILYFSNLQGIAYFAVLFGFTAFMIIVQWIGGPELIKRIMRLKQLPLNAEYAWVHTYVNQLSKSAKIKKPILYLAENDSPNAFAFGRTKNSAGLALHTGVFKILSKDEIKAVIAHEVGHIKHNDFVVMTIASTLPIILYFIAIMFTPRGNERSSGFGVGVFVGALIARFIGMLIVLWLSRTREYYADLESARLTKNPNNLITALGKIALGIGVSRPSKEMQTLRTFFIQDPFAHEKTSEIANALNTDIKEVERALKKESFIPELLMTHPRTSKRILTLKKISKEIKY